MREDLYQAKVTAEENLRKTGAWEKLSAEQKRLVEKMVLDGKRAGLALEKKEDREKLKVLKDELSDACLKFTVSDCFFVLEMTNLNNDTTAKLQ
jgi:Zn-dependent oligopeptidase